LGAFNFVQVQDQYLSGSGITSSATSITIETFDYPDGSDVVMADFGEIGYATLEPNTTREENISFTGITQNAAGTATLTGVTRGLGLKYPYTEVTANKFAHAGGTILRITNSAPFYNELVAKKNTAIIYGQLTLATTTGNITKLYFGDNNGAYIWYNSTTDQFGFASSSATERQFSENGTDFTVNETLKLTSGVLGLNTSTDRWFKVDSGYLNLNASSTGGITVDDNGIYVDKTDNFNWLGRHVFNGSVTTTGAIESTGVYTFKNDVYYNDNLWNPYSVATTSVATTTAEVDVKGTVTATSTIVANAIGTDGLLEVEFWGISNTSSATSSIQATYDDQVICSWVFGEIMPSGFGAPNYFSGKCTLMANNATNKQVGTGVLWITPTDKSSVMAVSSSTSPTIDTTSAKTFLMRIHSGDTNNISLTGHFVRTIYR
jgi:hypothetical protein